MNSIEKLRTELRDRVSRLNTAINAEVDDLMDRLERGPDEWAATALAELGRHLAETAADTLDMARTRP